MLQKIWSLSECVRGNELLKIKYKKANSVEVERLVKPVSIIFSEYYFYLIAYMSDFDSPTVFRVDRLTSFTATGEKFHIQNSERFEDGEFRKRVKFMYSGKLQRIKFEFHGGSLEAVLDRFPTANIISEDNNKYIIEAEVYGDGILIWILSQGKNVKLLSPTTLIEKLNLEITKMYETYNNILE